MPDDPRRLGGYELLGRLGQGGMGIVFLGRSAAGPLVAVKMVRTEYARDPEFRGRFRSEVNRAREVPGFCTAAVLDADPDHERPYLVVEYVDGPSLSEVIRERGRLDGSTLHSVAVGVATALAAIHGAGVIHRDLKPQNVLFSLGTPKVIDFGIARALEVTSRHTRTDQMVGTVAYMAPERFDTESDRGAGAPADVFAWGVVVAHAATGRTPFGADSPAATAARILTQPPDLSGLDGPLRELVSRTLAKDPAERPTAHQLLDSLLEADTGGALAQRPELRPELRKVAEAAQHTGRSRLPGVHPQAAIDRRWVRRAMAVTTVAVVTAAAIGFGLSQRRHDQTQVSFVPGATSSRSAGPVASTSAAAVTGTSRIQGTSVFDHLDRPGLWKADRSSADAGGWCTFDGRMLATTHASNVQQCRGPKDSFTGDQTIAFDAGIVTKGACAVVWFRVVDDKGYEASFCDDEIRLGLDLNAGNGFDETHHVASTAFQAGHTHRAGVAVRNGTAQATVDGRAVLSMPLTEPQLAAGRVVLGAAQWGGVDGDATVAFANVDLRSPVTGEPMHFPDPTTGSGRSVVELYSYDPVAGSAVAQPVLVLTSEEYCKRFTVDPDDIRCSDPFQIVESHQRVTIPVGAGPKLMCWRGAIDDVPVAARTGGGDAVSVPKFREWLGQRSGGLVVVTLHNGVATELTEIHTTS